MSEEFRKKIRDYMDGKLSIEEAAEMEKELEKLEDYQAVLDEQVNNGAPAGCNNKKSGEAGNEGEMAMTKKEKRIIRWGKWKARFHNALVALAIILAVTILSGIITSVYYGSGTPSRATQFGDVVASAIAVTEPNISFGNNASIAGIFFMGMEGDLKKTVGVRDMTVGEMEVQFLFGQAGYPKIKWLLQDNSRQFAYPGTTQGNASAEGWKGLEKLPEGTVAEAYLSFDRLFETDDILQKFKDKDMTPLWFAVDTGAGSKAQAQGASDYPLLGFPYRPLWHYADWTFSNRKEEPWGKPWGLFGKKISQSVEAPEVDPYGSGALRNNNFIDTLKLLKQYESITRRVVKGQALKLKETIEYLEKQGVKIYGLAVTGPTVEILKLKGEPWISDVNVGEARLWDWNSTK
ncbi:MAG: hypothetical protein FIA99_11670 [Ruminiclostridium sp.]|nr:hypothetical protein [Ruminiclostridium sp.]